MDLKSIVRANALALRQRLNLSPAEVRRRGGIAKATISRFESDPTKDIYLDSLEKLAKGLGVKPSVLLEYNPDGLELEWSDEVRALASLAAQLPRDAVLVEIGRFQEMVRRQSEKP